MIDRSNTAVGLGGDAFHVIIEQFDIHHNAGSGLFIHTTRGGHEIINCDSRDNYDPFSHQGDGQNADGFGAHYQETGDVTRFYGCHAWWNSDDGWDFISQEVPVLVENCWALGHGYANEGTTKPADGTGFMGPRQADGSLPELDFMKLSNDSQMIDKGTDVEIDFTGDAPNLGAYENQNRPMIFSRFRTIPHLCSLYRNISGCNFSYLVQRDFCPNWNAIHGKRNTYLFLLPGKE